MKSVSVKLSFILYILHPALTIAQTHQSKVFVVGEMKNVMWKGELSGILDIDTISNKTNLYGLGPVEFLSGEILILNGITYKSVVTSDSTMQVIKTDQVKAPFFGYAFIETWKIYDLPANIITGQQLEEYLNTKADIYPGPYFFKLSGEIETAKIHIVNLPTGSQVHSPEEAHQGLTVFNLENKSVEILGFYSQKHKAILTHHDTNLHLHLITDDRLEMGHLEEIRFKAGSVKLFMPE
ncbi:MAG: acetolactate decarboxylase [Bacteroidia bacterium]